jgi:hypothetical protein
MKRMIAFTAGLACTVLFALALSANPMVQQKHLMFIGDLPGGCSFCHNPQTGIQQSFQGMKMGQENYWKISTFKNHRCPDCHTRTGLTEKGKEAKSEAGY